MISNNFLYFVALCNVRALYLVSAFWQTRKERETLWKNGFPLYKFASTNKQMHIQKNTHTYWDSCMHRFFLYAVFPNKPEK